MPPRDPESPQSLLDNLEHMTIKPAIVLEDYQYQKAGDEIFKKAKMYGPPLEHFQEVARHWSAILGKEIKASEVCRCMCALKDVREKYKHDPDNLLDRHGYGLLYEMCQIEELKKKYIDD